MKASDLPLHYNAVDILERNLPERARRRPPSIPRSARSRSGRCRPRSTGTATRCATTASAWATPSRSSRSIRSSGSRRTSGRSRSAPSRCQPEHAADRGRVPAHAGGLPRARADLQRDVPRGRRARSIDELPFLERVLVIGSEEYTSWIAAASPELAPARTHREDICCLNYSSGTTGEPKGIPHAHKDLPLTAQLWGVNILGLTENDRTFAGREALLHVRHRRQPHLPVVRRARRCVLLAGAPREVRNVLGHRRPLQADTILYNAPTGYAMIAGGFEDGSQKSTTCRARCGMCVSAGEALPAPIWRAVEGAHRPRHHRRHRLDRELPHLPLQPTRRHPVRKLERQAVRGLRAAAGRRRRQRRAPGRGRQPLGQGRDGGACYLHQYDKSRRRSAASGSFTGDKYSA